LGEEYRFSIEDSKGWIIRITKTNTSKESLLFTCLLFRNSQDIRSEVDSGEHLDSLWIENKTDVISIGTEDGEMMKSRALKNDWMPSRFQSDLGYQSNTGFSFTKYLEFGFETKIPELKDDERFYFHYLIATNKKKKSKDYPNEDDISTNFAVGYPKWTLIEKLHLEEN
jgi:hypothetical protein